MKFTGEKLEKAAVAGWGGQIHWRVFTNFILFKTEDEKISVDVRFDEETVWLSQEQMAALFERDRSVIVKHIAKAPPRSYMLPFAKQPPPGILN